MKYVVASSRVDDAPETAYYVVNTDVGAGSLPGSRMGYIFARFYDEATAQNYAAWLNSTVVP